MRPYLDTARRYGWIIFIVLGLTWGSGIAMAYLEYSTSFQADATVWTQRGLLQLQTDGRLVVSPEVAPPQDPAVATLMTPAAEQAGVLHHPPQTPKLFPGVAAPASLPPPPSPSGQRRLFRE